MILPSEGCQGIWLNSFFGVDEAKKRMGAIEADAGLPVAGMNSPLARSGTCERFVRKLFTTA